MKVKPLVWHPPDDPKSVGFLEVAFTPFGKFTVFFNDGELWGPTPGSIHIGRYGNVDAAKAAAYEYLCKSISEMIEEE